MVQLQVDPKYLAEFDIMLDEELALTDETI
jgi:hypothetical protein